MKNGFVKVLSVGTMAVALSTMLVGCGPMTNNKISAPNSEYTTSFAGSETTFSNTNGFALTYNGETDGLKKYTASGTPSVMTNAQATAFGTTEGTPFVVLRIELGAGNTAKIGWTSTPETPLGEVDGSIIKESSASATGNGFKPYVLALTHQDMPYWRYEIQATDDMEAENFYIDFSALYTETE